MRTDALLSQFGYCSRREAPLWVKQGRVVFRGEPVGHVRDKVEPEETLVDGIPVEFPHGLYVAMNKPLGYTCSHRDKGPLVDELLPPRWLARRPAVSTVGRLDKETSGLLLLTDDGEWIHALTSPKRHVPKVYALQTAVPVPAGTASLFSSGTLMLEGESQPCLPAELEETGECSALLTLHEGRYHQVRRMMAAVGAPVVRLHRVAVGALRLEELHLQPGEWVAIDPSLFR